MPVKALGVSLLMVAFAALTCRADIIQLNLGGQLSLTGQYGGPVDPTASDPFDSSISATSPNPFTLTLTYDTNATPNQYGAYPGKTDTLNFGDYHETGTSSEIIPQGPTMMKIFPSSFVLPSGIQSNQTIVLASQTGSLFFSNLQDLKLSQISGSLISFQSYQSSQDALFGSITSFSSVDLSVPEPSVGALILFGFVLLAIGRLRLAR